jgi:hypothetical protein
VAVPFECIVMSHSWNDCWVPLSITGGWDNSIGKVQCAASRSSSSLTMADVCLGVTVIGLYTLVGMGLIIAFV